MDLKEKQIVEFLAGITSNIYLQALLVIVLSIGVAILVDVILLKIIKKWVKKTKLEIDDHVFDIIHKPIYLSVILFGLAIATHLLNFNKTLDFITIGCLKTIAILLWTVAVAKFLKILLSLFSRDDSRLKLIQDRTLPLFNNLTVILATAVSIYIIFQVWGIKLTAWVASAGIIGLAISLAAKDTLANLFSGVFIMADAPYKIGDFVVLDSGERGEVTNIGIRSTRLLTRDDVEITVPNSIMGNSKIINEAGGRHLKYRIRVKVGVAYGSDIDKVHSVLLDIAKNNEDVCQSPEPRVRFRAFGDSSLDHELLCWVERPVLRGRVLHALNTTVYKRFIQEDIEIPFPQRDLHVKSMPAASTGTDLSEK